MPLVVHLVPYTELQDFLNANENKVKFIAVYDSTRLLVILKE